MANRTNTSTNTYTNPGRRKRRQPRWGRILGVLAALAVVIAAATLVSQLLRDGQSVQPEGDNTLPDASMSDGQTPASDTNDIITLYENAQNYKGACTPDGMYYLTSEKHLDGAQNIKYIDYATKQSIFLCSSPSCTHDTPACTSYYPTKYAATEIFAAYGHLFLINFSGGEVNTLEMRDLNGSNARLLVSMGDAANFSGDNMYCAADPGHFYFCQDSALSIENGDIQYKKTLESVDIQTGEQTTVCQLSTTVRDENFNSSGTMDYCMGSCGRYFILHASNFDTQQITVFAVDIQGNRTDALHLPDPWVDNRTLRYTNTNLLYQMDFDGGSYTFTELDMLTGQRRTVVEGYPTSHAYDTWFGVPVDGYMLFGERPTDEQGNETPTYILDLTTGEYRPFSLIYDALGLPSAVAPWAEVDGYFLVRIGYRDTGAWIGASPTINGSAPIFALISKEDYWNSVANYIPITDTLA